MAKPGNLESVQGLRHYEDLKYYFSNLNTLFSIRSYLAIDMVTATPAGGMQRRLQDIANITKRVYAETTGPAVSRLLDQVEAQAESGMPGFGSWDIANVREMRRIHNHLSALMPDYYIASVRIANEGRKRHRAALESGNWKEAEPYLRQVVDLYRKIAEQKQGKFGARTPYNALLLGYASDIDETQVDRLYGELLGPLRALLDQAVEKQKEHAAPLPLEGRFSRGDQMWLNRTVLELMGFDFTRGGLFVTGMSPMTGGTPEDVRVLVRCEDGGDFLHSLADTLYQGARGIHLQSLPGDWKTQPVGQDVGALMMNALSILYETIIGRTPQFFSFIAARAEGVFRQFRNPGMGAENLYRLRKAVAATARRNDADEMTKIFHDVLRYRIEKDLINGSLDISGVPERWNDESRALLGHAPQSSADGPLQNPDWFTGRFGFIPTNTLSHIIAADLHERIFSENPHLPQQIEKGDFSFVGSWLKKNIHDKGRSVGALEMAGHASGHEPGTRSLLDHLERRYLSDKR